MKLRIEKPLYGGAGLARLDGKAVFVPMALPGELVEAVVRRDKGNFAEAELVEVVEAAPERIGPPCPYYGACGGCQYQHASYEVQLAMKQAILPEILHRAGLRDLPTLKVHAGEPWGYRNRIRLHVDPVSHLLGYRRRASHALLPVAACPIAAASLQACIPALQEAAREHKAGAWCSEIELFTNQEGSETLLNMAARPGADPGRAFQRFCEIAQARAVQITGGGLFRTGPGSVVEDDDDAPGRELARWGQQALEYKVGNDKYRVSTGAFFQANRFLIETLIRPATDGVPGRLAWDLFAGVGLFSRVLARRFERIVAVEGAPVSCADLRVNLRSGKVVESDVLGFLRRSAREKPDLVVLDPPRAGLGKEASGLLSRIGTPHVTYVSCDPATLARDLKVFADSGYALTQLDLVDMFPQTFHMEVVAKLRRG